MMTLMVALAKMTGATVWTARELDDEAGYVSPVVADVSGVRTIFTITAESAVGERLHGVGVGDHHHQRPPPLVAPRGGPAHGLGPRTSSHPFQCSENLSCPNVSLAVP